MATDSRILVWDVPTRALHWLLTVLVAAAVILAVVGERGPAFPWHMLLGLAAGAVVVVRIVWGVVGSRHAKFASFPFEPSGLIAYLRGAFTRSASRYVGHNPASSWGAIGMLALTLGLAVTGVLMTSGRRSEAAEELHGVLVVGVFVLVAVHLVGIVWHTIRHKEAIAMTMVHGKKDGAPEQAIVSAYTVSGILAVVLVLGWTAALVAGYDAAQGRVRMPLLGTSLTLHRGAGTDRGPGHHGGPPSHDDDD